MHRNIVGVAALAAAAHAWPTTTCTDESAPSSTALPDCWSSCFTQNGITSESALCGNTAVDACIHSQCSSDLDEQYWTWYDGFCKSTTTTTPVATTTPTPSAYTTPASTTVSTTASPTPTYPACWEECFNEEGVTSEASLCGNTAVDACIQNKCSGAEDQAYWSWYESFCPATTSPTTYATTTPATTTTTSATATPTCWTECFTENDVTSEESLCGNTAVDACIQNKCSGAEDQAYWAWYESFCPATTSPTTYATTTPVSATTTVATPSATPSCWSTCFAEFNVTSEAALCGNTEVDACIQADCSAAEDQAYWAWYESFCPSTSATGTPTGYTTAPVSTGTVPAATTPVSYGSTGIVPPASPVAPTTYGTPAAATGTGVSYTVPATNPSGYPVPATGDGVQYKPAMVLLAAVVGAVALL